LTPGSERGAALALTHAAALERAGELTAVSRQLIQDSAALCEHRRGAAEAQPRRRAPAD